MGVNGSKFRTGVDGTFNLNNGCMHLIIKELSLTYHLLRHLFVDLNILQTASPPHYILVIENHFDRFDSLRCACDFKGLGIV